LKVFKLPPPLKQKLPLKQNALSYCKLLHQSKKKEETLLQPFLSYQPSIFILFSTPAPAHHFHQIQAFKMPRLLARGTGLRKMICDQWPYQTALINHFINRTNK